MIAVDNRQQALDLATKVGADHVVTSDNQAAGAVKDLTGGHGADVLLDFVGAEATIELARTAARPLGDATIVGIAGGSVLLSFFAAVRGQHPDDILGVPSRAGRAPRPGGPRAGARRVDHLLARRRGPGLPRPARRQGARPRHRSALTTPDLPSAWVPSRIPGVRVDSGTDPAERGVHVDRHNAVAIGKRCNDVRTRQTTTSCRLAGLLLRRWFVLCVRLPGRSVEPVLQPHSASTHRA